MGQFAALRSIFGLFDLSAAPDADHKATQLVLRETERVHRLLKQQKLELDAVLDNMVQGVVMLDAHARIMICNRRYLEIYGLSADVVKPGCTLKALIQHRVEVGHVHGDIDDTVRKIVATLAERRPSTAIAHLTNGRIVSVTTQPMAEGGGREPRGPGRALGPAGRPGRTPRGRVGAGAERAVRPLRQVGQGQRHPAARRGARGDDDGPGGRTDRGQGREGRQAGKEAGGEEGDRENGPGGQEARRQEDGEGGRKGARQDRDPEGGGRKGELQHGADDIPTRTRSSPCVSRATRVYLGCRG